MRAPHRYDRYCICYRAEFLESFPFASLSFGCIFSIRRSCELSIVLALWWLSLNAFLFASLFQKEIASQLYLQLSRNSYGNPTGQRPHRILFSFGLLL